MHGKSWDRKRLSDLVVAPESSRRAMAMTGVEPSDVDAVVVVTGTPYQIMVDQDSFQPLRGLGIRDGGLGNLVSASTAQMPHEDIQGGVVGAGHRICLSEVGAGPERGAFVLPAAVRGGRGGCGPGRRTGPGRVPGW